MSTQYGDLQWYSHVQAAFPDQELCKRIFAEASYEPTRLPRLFEDISKYVESLKTTIEITTNTLRDTSTKKRKLDDGNESPRSPYRNGQPPIQANKPELAFNCQDISVQIPVRKKLCIQLVRDYDSGLQREIRLMNQKTTEPEYILPTEQIDHVFCLPVPEKQQRQSYFAIFPRPGTTDSKGVPVEQLLFAVNDKAPAELASTADGEPIGLDDSYVTVTQQSLDRFISVHHKRIVYPIESEFASARPQSHRKGEKAYHVNAYRGSKEGYLFFLATGILFGFKKPMTFFPFSHINSISYTSVLQRTFNLVIAAFNPADIDLQDIKEHEFSMLDQEDFAGIDEYVKRHGLNDASMAAQRRAKAYNVNKEKGGDQNGEEAAAGGVQEDGRTELQKAEQQLQDEEDEEEEDYEASGGESDGEGEYSEDEDEDGEGYDEEGGDEDAEGVEYDEADGHDQ